MAQDSKTAVRLRSVLIACPECTREVSDRALACPGCGFPVAEHLEQTRLAEALVEDRKTRETAGDTDCVACQARGFETFEEADDDGKPRSAFAWCEICEHSGRVALCRSKSGYWAVRRNRLDEFLAGLLDVHATDVVALGETQPPARYPARA